MRLFVILIVGLFALPVGASELVGATVPPYPNSMTSDMGSCIADDDDICAYSIATLNRSDGSVAALAAMKLIQRLDGRPVWKIVDALDVPDPLEGQLWAFEDCHVDGKLDPSVIGLVSFKDMGGWIESDQTVWAVRFVVAASRLVELDPVNVRCVLPGS